MNLSVTQAFPKLEAFHRANGTEMFYQPQRVTQRSRGGAVLSATEIKPKCISVIMDLNPTPEQVTSFGDTSDFRYGRRAVFRVLASDCQKSFGKAPAKKDAFEWQGKTYSIMAIQPLQRGGVTFKFDCLVGFE